MDYQGLRVEKGLARDERSTQSSRSYHFSSSSQQPKCEVVVETVLQFSCCKSNFEIEKAFQCDVWMMNAVCACNLRHVGVNVLMINQHPEGGGGG